MMKNPKNSIVTFLTFLTFSDDGSGPSSRLDSGQVEAGRGIEPDSGRFGLSGAEMGALTELARQSPRPDDVVKICRKNGIDERKAFRYLGDIDSVGMHHYFQDRAIMSISASDILEDGPIPGIDETFVRRLFGYMCGSFVEYMTGPVGLDNYDWIREKIKPKFVAGVSQVMARLMSRMRDAVGVVYHVEDRVENYPSDIFIEPTASEVIDALIDGRDFSNDEANLIRVYLETSPGQYDWIPCRIVQAEAERFDHKWRRDEIFIDGMDSVQVPSRANNQAQDGGPAVLNGNHAQVGDGGPVILNGNHAQAPEDKPENESEDMSVLGGIAKDFASWYDLPGDENGDAILSYIIKNKRLPAWASMKVRYRGKTKADAVRFWREVGMTESTWNMCFKTDDGKPIGSAYLRKKKALAIDKKKNKGIYIPLAKHGF